LKISERIKRTLYITILAGTIICIIDILIDGTFDYSSIKYTIGFGVGLYLGSGWDKK